MSSDKDFSTFLHKDHSFCPPHHLHSKHLLEGSLKVQYYQSE